MLTNWLGETRDDEWVLQRVLDCARPLAPPLNILLGPGPDAVTVEPGAGRGGRALSLYRGADGWFTDERRAGAPVEAGQFWQWGGQIFRLRRGRPPGVPAPGADATMTMTSLDPTLSARLARLARVADSPVPVLITGETGTGKELLARAVHQRSGRKGRFVAVNCAALSETLIHAQLFGHRRGAFSGAIEAQPGFVREADGGTLFLDEVGDLPLPAQGVLLRVLQEREVCPVGSARAVPVDLRVVSATNRNLEEMVAAKEFREDLYARLLGFRIELPPLRARADDLGMIVANLLRKTVAAGAAPTITPRAALELLRHPWPLNVRQLEQCIAVAVVLAGDGPIDLEHLSLEGPRRVPVAAAGGGVGASRARPLTAEDQCRRQQLLALLAQHRGNITAVARATGKARMQIHRWLRRYDIDRLAFGAAADAGAGRPPLRVVDIAWRAPAPPDDQAGRAHEGPAPEAAGASGR